MIQFIENVFTLALEDKETAPETGPAILRLMRESELFRLYVLGQVSLTRDPQLKPDQVIRGSIGFGYMLAEYVMKTQQ